VVEEGKPAPDFELQSDSGETVKLSGLRGKSVVLYFYPKDDTKVTKGSNTAVLQGGAPGVLSRQAARVGSRCAY
jgi:peroxiredoxin